MGRDAAAMGCGGHGLRHCTHLASLVWVVHQFLHLGHERTHHAAATALAAAARVRRARQGGRLRGVKLLPLLAPCVEQRDGFVVLQLGVITILEHILEGGSHSSVECEQRGEARYILGLHLRRQAGGKREAGGGKRRVAGGRRAEGQDYG